MKRIIFLIIISIGLSSGTVFSAVISVPYITDVKILPTAECNTGGGAYISPYCILVIYSSYKASVSMLDQVAPRPGVGSRFGIYSRKVVGTETYVYSNTNDVINIGSGVTWHELIDMLNKKLPSSGTVTVGLMDTKDDWQDACVAFGAHSGNGGGVGTQDVMLPTSNTCIPIPRPDVSCSFNVNDINFSFGTLNTNSIDGTTQNKSFVANCTEDTDVQYSLVNDDVSGFVEMSSTTASSIIYSHLYLDGNSMSSGTLKTSEKEGDNTHQLTATLEGSNGAEAGHYTGSAVLIISPQ